MQMFACRQAGLIVIWEREKKSFLERRNRAESGGKKLLQVNPPSPKASAGEKGKGPMPGLPVFQVFKCL